MVMEHPNWLEYAEYKRFPINQYRIKPIITGVQRLSMENSKKRLKILEIGCGKGNITIPLGSLGHEVLGIDYHDESLATARKNNPFKPVRFIKGDVKKFLVKTGKGLSRYDAVVACEILEHLNAPENIIGLLGKHGKKGVRFFITVPNGYSYWEGIGYFLHRLRRTKGIKDVYFWVRRAVGKKDPCTEYDEDIHVNWFTFSRLRKMLENAGFRVVRSENLFVFYNPIQCFLPFLKVPDRLLRAELKLTNVMPHAMVNGWFVECVKD